MTTDKYKVIQICNTSNNNLLLEDDLVYIDINIQTSLINLWKAEDVSDREYLGGISEVQFNDCLELEIP